MVVHDDVPPRIVLDAGPLIGAFNRRDRFHEVSGRGLRHLAAGNSRILVPMPVVFEVFKWLAYNVGAGPARLALSRMRGNFEVIDVHAGTLAELAAMVESMPRWPGSLEDAFLAHVGGRMNAPVWTFNYRDLRAFTHLQFWTPG
jgi:predicted nucleic acid-binding protein